MQTYRSTRPRVPWPAMLRALPRSAVAPDVTALSDEIRDLRRENSALRHQLALERAEQHSSLAWLREALT